MLAGECEGCLGAAFECGAEVAAGGIGNAAGSDLDFRGRAGDREVAGNFGTDGDEEALGLEFVESGRAGVLVFAVVANGLAEEAGANEDGGGQLKLNGAGEGAEAEAGEFAAGFAKVVALEGANENAEGFVIADGGNVHRKTLGAEDLGNDVGFGLADGGDLEIESRLDGASGRRGGCWFGGFLGRFFGNFASGRRRGGLGDFAHRFLDGLFDRFFHGLADGLTDRFAHGFGDGRRLFGGAVDDEGLGGSGGLRGFARSGDIDDGAGAAVLAEDVAHDKEDPQENNYDEENTQQLTVAED